MVPFSLQYFCHSIAMPLDPGLDVWEKKKGLDKAWDFGYDKSG